MATPAGGKVRSKRSHNTRKPYERPKAKSLLTRVSDTVKDFITPSWLNNLWNNPNDDDGEGSSRSSTPELPQGTHIVMGTPNCMPAAVATSTPDIGIPLGKEGLSIPRPSHAIVTTPIVHSENTKLQDSGKMDGGEDDDVVIIDEDQPSTSTGIRHTPLPFRNYADPIGTSTPNEDMQLLGGRKPVVDKDDASDTSVSTSGCSSLLPHIDKVDHKEKLSKKNLDRLSEMGHSNSLAKSSLWTDTSMAGPSGLSSSRPQQPVSIAKRPSFNSSYFGSPRLLSETRPKNASPFYPGRTQFGGLSAQRSALKRPRNSPYEVHLPVKRNVRPKPAPISRDSTLGTTSSTAKKILDTLERMSTPLLDAKKIPLSPAASPYSFRPSSRLGNLPGSSRTKNQPPVSGLRVPHQVSIAPSRQPPVTQVIDLEETEERTKPEVFPTSTAAPTISTAPSFRYGVPTSTSTPASASTSGSQLLQERAGGKMKSKSRNTLHYSSQQTDDDDVVEVPNLPEIALPLSKGLPKFNFTSQAESSTSRSSQPALFSAEPPVKSSSTSLPTTQKSPAPSLQFSAPASKAASATSEAASDKPQFKFASPIIKQSSSGAASSSTSSSSSTFKFSMPRQTPYTTNKPSSSLSMGAKKPSFETPERTRRKEDDVQKAEDKDGGSLGGIKVAKELKTGSCLEAFGILPTQNGPIPSSSTMVQAHAAKVSNSLDNGPLSSSVGQKTGESILSNATSKPSKTLLDKFKPAADSLECDTCMLPNQGEDNKCIARDTPKPGPSKPKQVAKDKPTAVSQNVLLSDSKPSSTFNSLSNKFSKKANEWECDVCMIRNEDSADNCVACSTPRPGQSKSHVAVKPQQTAAINNVIADKFKAAAGEWECDTCMIRNKANILKCMACDTPKPGSSQTLSAPPASSFKFGSGSMSNGDATGALKFGSSSSSSTLNSNHSASKDTSSSIGGQFKLPTGVSIGQSFKPASTDSNGSSSSVGGGFKIPSNFSLSKAGDSSEKTTNLTGKPSEPSLISEAKLENKSDSKLEVKVSGPFTFGASGSSTTSGGASATGGFQFGQGSASKADSVSSSQLPSGGFKFGQSEATVGQSLLDKEGPPPNVNLFESKVTEEDGPAAKKTLTFGSTSEASQEKKTESVAPAFKFGGVGASTTKESTSKPSAASFQFGAGAATAAFSTSKAEDSKSNVAEAKPLFPFGGATSSTSSQTPSTENKSQFSFGGTASSTTSSTPASATSTPSFTFGSNKPAEGGSTASHSKTTFTVTFGTQNTANPSQASNQGLNFGATNKESTAATTPAATFNFGETAAPPPASAAPSFTFGAAPASSKTEEAAKPAFSFGSQNQNNNQGTSSGFSFGAAPASSNPPAQTTPSFSFGAAAAKPPATTSSSGFSFGSTPNSNTGFTGQSSVFGAGNTNPPPAFGAAPATTQSSAPFTFGSTPTTTASNPFGGSGSTNATPFGGQAPTQGSVFGSANPGPTFGAPSGGISQTPAFGSSANANTNSAPAFGSGTGGLTNSAPTFGTPNKPAPSFGSGTNAFGSGAANSASGGFQFGKTQTGPAFQFGATNNAPANPAAGGAFQFTGNQQNQAPQATPAVAPQPAGGFNFSTGQPPSFNFGGNAPQPGTTAFQFQATGVTNDSNPFSASGTPGAQSGRKIKRAVRRTAKR